MNKSKYTVKKALNHLALKFDAYNPLSMFVRFYVNQINKKEYFNPPFNLFNERPVEYRFVFTQLANYYPKKVLDVGTGLTALPHLMANCGMAVTAIDNIKDYWPMGMFNRHYYVINQSITNPQLNEKFDLVTCISTLEHIDDFNQAVKSMFALLNPGGHLVLTFPYNEEKFVDNVYALPNSNVKQLPYHKAHAYSRDQLNNWCAENKATLVEQEYWHFFTGDYWTVGDKLTIPKKVNKEEKHQISCVVFEKNG